MESSIAWHGNAEAGYLSLLDQTRLPLETKVLRIESLADTIEAIKRLAVRGAPAIGIAAAYGVILGLRERQPKDLEAFGRDLKAVCSDLAASRPTAVNLGWATRRMEAAGSDPSLAERLDLEALLAEAVAIHNEDRELCTRIGQAGVHLIEDGMTVLTHCNTGRLATAGDGTALAVMFATWQAGKRFRVLADETRPLLQGARLTAFELVEAGIPVDVLCDSAAAGLIGRGDVDLILTGADRIAANGDAANKVGTYGLALAAAAHDVPMYIAAPASTFDLSIDDGTAIPIEDRGPEEILSLAGHRVAAPGAGARNPAFDVTPGGLLRGLITDRGMVEPVTKESIAALFG